MNVPDKPSLDGLEAKWGEWWEAAGTYRFDRTKHARGDLLDRHPAADRQRHRCTWARSFATRRPTRWRATSGCAAGGLLPDGVGRQRPGHRAPRAELLRRALRPLAARTTRSSTPPRSSAPTTSRSRSVAPNFIELCERLDRRGREGVRGRCGGGSGSRSTGRMTYTTIGERSRRRVAARVPRDLARGEALHSRRADAVGRRLPHRGRAGRARGSRDRPARTTRCAFDATDGGDVVIETTRPELLAGVRRAGRASRRRALPAARSAPTVLTPLFGVARARCSRTGSPTPRRAPASR